MKSEVKGYGMPVSKKSPDNLLNETKETLVTDAVNENTHRILTAAELWNIHKQHKSAAMRRWLN
jgi:hypothetical protein